MQRDDAELEKYLSEFRPRALRPLELPQPVTIARPKRLAVAAMILIIIGGWLWYRSHGKTGLSLAAIEPHSTGTGTQNRRLTTLALTKLALQDDLEFQAQLAAESRLVLPTFQAGQSALHALSKE